jgi:hypothetical protein
MGRPPRGDKERQLGRLPLIVVMVLILPFNIRPKNRINHGLIALSGLAEIF